MSRSANLRLMLAALVLLPAAAHADIDAETRCWALRTLELPGLKIDGAKIPSPDDGQPEYCRVTGVIDRARFELRLPTTQWNGKYYMTGCGSACGIVNSDSAAYKAGVTRGYASITTDAGHQSWTPIASQWARDNAEARTDHAWRAVHRTAVTGRRITAAYYGTAAQHAYFNGCSNGGRQGLMEATRFPADFDGILAEAPAQAILPMMMLYTYVLLADSDAEGNSIFNASKLPLLQSAVAKACGDEYGVVKDPQACTFDPAALQCVGADGPDCLAAAEVKVLRAWYAGPPGAESYPALGGVPRGSEAFWAGRAPAPLLLRLIWPFVPGMPATPLDSVLAGSKIGATVLMRDLLSTPAFDPDYDARDFEPRRDLPRLTQFAAEMTPSRDLTALRTRGAKLIITQGTADSAVPPAYTLDYWREARAKLGERADETLRLFMIPGMGHCGNFEGPPLAAYDTGDYDALGALEAWVEQGRAPDALAAAHHDPDGRISRSEPLCALPARAVYSGLGKRAQADNWRCQ